MKRFLLALAIPAALVLSGCASSGPEADPKPSTTSTFNVLDGLALPSETSAATVTTTRSTVPSPSGATTEVTPGDLAQTCPDALAAIEFFVSMDPSGNPDRQAIAASVLDMIKDGGAGFTSDMEEAGWEVSRDAPAGDGRAWESLTPAEQRQAESAVMSAADGEC